MIYDCFLYNGEQKMLELRLNELNEYVDYFVITESEFTFKGDKKEIKFTEHKDIFEKFKDKIFFLKHSNIPSENAWENERNQREYFITFFEKVDLNKEDIILLSDVDEIPDTAILQKIKNNFNSIGVFCQNFYYYNISCRNKSKWFGTIAVNVSFFLSALEFNFEKLRSTRSFLPRLSDPNDYTSGGWHFSYFGDINYIISKIESFSHQEFNNELYKNPETIKKLIEEGKDLFFRDSETFEKVEEKYLPKHIQIIL
jgi:beta-1,4-mannosyl-glycoprotein beta-1,4-N-acetylglucosaminyltransferase